VKRASAPAPTPRELGFRHPAEWEHHIATWLGWPHNTSDWPGKFTPIPWVYGEIARHVAPGEIVRILVNDRSHEASARRILNRVGVDPARIEFFRFPTDRGWMRDIGPIFVRRDAPSGPPAGSTGETAIAGFRFNAWAKYDNWKRDARIPALAAKRLNKRFFVPEFGGRHVVLEGGSIDLNGRGTLLTTEECLLDPVTQVRNPGMPRAVIESVLLEYLGASNVLWLGKGIAGDDTHGHVDDLCRFVSPTTAVLCEEQNPKDANYGALNENRERMQDMRLENGSRVQVVPLPMPAPVVFDGQRLPASYANFYIANAAVLVPTFNDPNDRIALGILAELITDRPVIGIHAVDLVWGLGTLHCLTHEEPRS
jgi:agmatine deiminase